MAMSKRALIHNIRLGYHDLQDLEDDALVNLIDYDLPGDVIDLCLRETARRRDQRLAKKREQDRCTGSGGK